MQQPRMPPTARKSDKPKRRFTTARLKKLPARYNGKHPGGRPTAYRTAITNKICTLIAQGNSLRAACIALKIPEDTVYAWLVRHAEFRRNYTCARDVRADIAFGEQILDIADDVSTYWRTAANGRQVVNKELVLRSKLRIEARQFHMSRLHPQQWGDRQQIDMKSDYSLMSEDERVKRASELIGVIKEIVGPKPQPPPLRYDPGPTEEEPEPGGIG